MSKEYNLCTHLKALFSGLIPDDALARRIGWINSLPDDLFYAYCKDIRYAVGCFLQNRVIEENSLKVVRCGKFRLSDEQLEDGQLRLIPETSDILLNTVFSLSSSPTRDSYLAAMMKLKTGRSTPATSRSEIDDIYASITQPPNWDIDLVQQVQREIGPFLDRFFRPRAFLKDVPREYVTLIGVFANPEKMSYVSLDGRNDATRYRRVTRNQITAYNCIRFLRDPRVRKLIELDPDSVISSVFTGVDVRNGRFHFDKPETGPQDIGYISIIPEPGKKLRVVANPNLFLACASNALGKFLKSCNSSWSVQGVDSHEGTTQFISNKLRECQANKPRTFYSVDMKNFTDRLPYEGLQREILVNLGSKGLIKPFDIEVMDIICHGSYQFQGSSISYGAGTPQGTQPSFPLASFANGMVASIAFKWAHNLAWDRINLNRIPCRVIGDDIVIWDTPTNEAYRRIMKGLGVVCSEDKCITSMHYAEMCSKLISPDGIYQQKKILRREDKEFTPLQTIASRMDYYATLSEEVLSNYLDSSGIPSELITLINSVPRPYGRGSDIKDILSKVTLNQQISNIELDTLVGHLASIINEVDGLSLGDLKEIFERKALFPQMEYEERELETSPKRESSSADPLLISLQQDFRDMEKELFKLYPYDVAPDTSREQTAGLIKTLNNLEVGLMDRLDKLQTGPHQRLAYSPDSAKVQLERYAQKCGIAPHNGIDR